MKGGLQLDKNPSPAWVEDQKKVIISSLRHFSQAETSLASRTTPKPTHCPWLKVIFALHATNHRQLGAPALSEGVLIEPLQPPISATIITEVVLEKVPISILYLHIDHFFQFQFSLFPITYIQILNFMWYEGTYTCNVMLSTRGSELGTVKIETLTSWVCISHTYEENFKIAACI